MTSEQAKNKIRRHLSETTRILEDRFLAHRSTFQRRRDPELLKKELDNDRRFYEERLAEANRLKRQFLDQRSARVFDKGRIQSLKTHFQAHAYCLEKLLTTEKPKKATQQETAQHQMLNRWRTIKVEHIKRVSKIDPCLPFKVFKAKIDKVRRTLQRDVTNFRVEALLKAQESDQDLPGRAEEYLVTQNALLDTALQDRLQREQNPGPNTLTPAKQTLSAVERVKNQHRAWSKSPANGMLTG